MNDTQLRNRQYINNAKSVPCADCGVRYPHYVMDFDHRAGMDKKFCISNASYSRGLVAIMNEIAKCDVVCVRTYR